MNKSSSIFLVSGIIFGFILCYVIVGKCSTNLASAQNIQTIKPNVQSDDLPVKIPKDKEKNLLLLAIEELDLTTSELEAAQQHIRILERNTKRYNWLLNHWKEKGLGAGHKLHFDSENMIPSQNLIDFFGWDEDVVHEIEDLGLELCSQTKNWEEQQATCTLNTPTNRAFKIPPVPDSYIDHYAEGMVGILDPDDIQLLSSMLEGNCNRLLSTRTISMKVVHAPKILMNPVRIPEIENYPHDADWMVVHEIPHDQLTPISGISSMSIPYTSEDIIPERWKHLYNAELN